MKTLLTAGLIALGATSAYAESKDMVVSCTQRVQDYAWYLDHPGEDMVATSKAFAEIFTEDAVLKLNNAQFVEETFVGHDAIASRYLQGRDVMRFLHVTGNVRIVPTGDDTAMGTNYVTVYIHPVGGSMAENSIQGIAEYRDEYRMTEDGCRISNRFAYLRLLGDDGAIADPQP